MCIYLEGQVLEEVGGAICLCRLSSRTGVDPHANGRGLGVGRVLGSDGQAILEGGGLGLEGTSDGGREVSSQRHRRERLPAEALGKVQSESPGRHGEEVPMAWVNLREGQFHPCDLIGGVSTWRPAI